MPNPHGAAVLTDELLHRDSCDVWMLLSQTASHSNLAQRWYQSGPSHRILFYDIGLSPNNKHVTADRTHTHDSLFRLCTLGHQENVRRVAAEIWWLLRRQRGCQVVVVFWLLPVRAASRRRVRTAAEAAASHSRVLTTVCLQDRINTHKQITLTKYIALKKFTSFIYTIITSNRPTTHLSTPEGWKAELA